jgi:hypothetical protein
MKYFSKTELIRCYREKKSDRCSECRLTQAVRRMPNNVDVNMEALVDNVLDPAREAYGHPIYVNSGFRCPLHNAAVGGVSKSQHIEGQAADITAGSPAENLKLARIIAQLGNYDQIIVYVNPVSSEPQFIHVSYKRPSTGSGTDPNRKRILKKVLGRDGYQVVPSL